MGCDPTQGPPPKVYPPAQPFAPFRATERDSQALQARNTMNDRPLVIGKEQQRRDKYTWRYRHSLGKDPVTGKYRYSPWQTIHTTKSREVDAALEAYKAELNSGTYVQKSRDTVARTQKSSTTTAKEPSRRSPTRHPTQSRTGHPHHA